MATFTRTETDLNGTIASPTSIAGSGSSTSSALDLTGTNTADGSLVTTVIIGGSAPGSAPTIAFQDSWDGTNYHTMQTLVCANATGTTYEYGWVPTHPSVKKSRSIVTNGMTNAITTVTQGNTRAVT